MLLATVEADGRMEVTARPELAWKAADGKDCVVQVLARGCLCITLLDAWAERHSMDEQAARAELTRREAEAEEGQFISREYLVQVKRKGGSGRSVFRVQLGPVGIWALFRQGEGPLNTRFKRTSAQVLVRGTGDDLHVWTHEGFEAMVR